jgi:hypothetical protein
MKFFKELSSVLFDATLAVALVFSAAWLAKVLTS